MTMTFRFALLPGLGKAPVGKDIGQPADLGEAQHLIRLHAEFPADFRIAPVAPFQLKNDLAHFHDLMLTSCPIVANGGSDAVVAFLFVPVQDYAREQR